MLCSASGPNQSRAWHFRHRSTLRLYALRSRTCLRTLRVLASLEGSLRKLRFPRCIPALHRESSRAGHRRSPRRNTSSHSAPASRETLSAPRLTCVSPRPDANRILVESLSLLIAASRSMSRLHRMKHARFMSSPARLRASRHGIKPCWETGLRFFRIAFSSLYTIME